MEMQSRHGARTSDPDQQAYLVQRGKSRVTVGFQAPAGNYSMKKMLEDNFTTFYTMNLRSHCEKYSTLQSYPTVRYSSSITD